MLNIIPVAKSVKNNAVPPLLINNNGSPESGNKPSIEAMFKND